MCNLSLVFITIPWSFGPVIYKGTCYPVDVVTDGGGAFGLGRLLLINYWNSETPIATTIKTLIKLLTSWVCCIYFNLFVYYKSTLKISKVLV